MVMGVAQRHSMAMVTVISLPPGPLVIDYRTYYLDLDVALLFFGGFALLRSLFFEIGLIQVPMLDRCVEDSIP